MLNTPLHLDAHTYTSGPILGDATGETYLWRPDEVPPIGLWPRPLNVPTKADLERGYYYRRDSDRETDKRVRIIHGLCFIDGDYDDIEAPSFESFWTDVLEGPTRERRLASFRKAMLPYGMWRTRNDRVILHNRWYHPIFEIGYGMGFALPNLKGPWSADTKAKVLDCSTLWVPADPSEWVEGIETKDELDIYDGYYPEKQKFNRAVKMMRKLGLPVLPMDWVDLKLEQNL